LAELLEALIAAWPVRVEGLVLIGHSTGGLVARSAHHCATAAGHVWPAVLRAMVFLGTPHHGAPLERGGHWVDVLLGATPYTAPFSQLGRVRSAGITDLRHGNVREEDWRGRDRFARAHDPREPLPLPAGVDCYAVAATTMRKRDKESGPLGGDGLVPVVSALGRHRDPRFALAFAPSCQWIVYGTGHLELLSSAAVYAQVRDWLRPARTRNT
jgi:pimeloyl-ACP methyl ester carboxylesterase